MSTATDLSAAQRQLLRVSLDLGVGAGFAAGLAVALAVRQPHLVLSGAVPAALVAAAVAFCVAIGPFSWARRFFSSLAIRVTAVMFAVGLLFTMPVLLALVAALCVIWACLLAEERAGLPGRWWGRRGVDLAAAVLAGLCLELIAGHDPLAGQLAAGVLLAAGALLSIRLWFAMNRSDRLTVRCGADIVLSLLLGAGLVLALVWIANQQHLAVADVAALRSLLGKAGSAADLPWWLWAGLYVLLAGASLAFALKPERLAAAARWTQRLRVIPSVGISRRVLTAIHLGLLVIVLVGVAGPPALGPPLRSQAARYTVAFQRQLRARYIAAIQREQPAAGERAAYQAIYRQFSDGRPLAVQPLDALVARIHKISSPPPGHDDATSTERNLASRLGRLQAAIVRVPATRSLLTAEASAEASRFRPPAEGITALHKQVSEPSPEERRAKFIKGQIASFAELAAGAVAGSLQVPHVGENEATQIIKEYLSGLLESGPVKDVFSAWAQRLVKATATPSADRLVVPDPARLEQAAFSQETAQSAAAGTGFADPAVIQVNPATGSSAAGRALQHDEAVLNHDLADGLAGTTRLTRDLARADKDLAAVAQNVHLIPAPGTPPAGKAAPTPLRGPPIDAAVDLVNETRTLSEGPRGSCDGCTGLVPPFTWQGHLPPLDEHHIQNPDVNPDPAEPPDLPAP